MKRFLAILLMVCMLIPQSVCASGEEDGPVIGDVSIDSPKKVYTGGDTVVVRIEASDPAGITSAGATWQLDGTEQYFSDGQVDVQNGGIVLISFPITRRMSSGTWNLIDVFVGNTNDKYTNKAATGISIEVDNLSYVKPTVTNLSVTPTEGAAGETEFEFIATIEQGTSEIDAVSVDLVFGFNQSYYPVALYKTDNPKVFRGVSTFADAKIRTLSFDMITICTTDGEWFYYTTDGRPNGNEDSQIINTDFDGITLTNRVEDTDVPELLGFSFENATVYTPGTIKLNLTVKDDTTAVEEVEIVKVKVVDETEEEMLPEIMTMNSLGDSPGEPKVFTFSEDCSRYTQSYSCYIKSIKLKDTAGNESFYSIEDDSENRIEKKIVNIVNNNMSDVFLSLSDPQLCDKVAQIEEGAMAVVDTSGSTLVPEEFFRIIKGKDITIIFEQMYSSGMDDQNMDPTGIQWIINGKDISEKNIKPINVGIKVQRAYIPSPWLTYQEKLHEKPMPRFNLDVPELLDPIIKEKLIEDGYEDVIPQVYALQEKGEYFSETYIRLVSEIGYIEMVFADNGVLPAKSTIRLKPSYALRGLVNTKDVFLHFINPDTNKFELVQSGIYCDDEGYYEFGITHNSTYALDNGIEEIVNITDDQSGKKDTGAVDTNTITKEKKTVKTGDSNMIIALILLLMISGGLLVWTGIRKKKIG